MQIEIEVLPFLDPKPLAAAEYYLRYKDRRKAYRKAGYKAKSDAVADTAASQLFSNVKVAKYIRMRQEEINERVRKTTNVTVERITKELSLLGFQTPKGMFRPDGTFKNIDDLTDEQAATVAGFETIETFEMQGKERVWTGYIKKVKFWPKTAATDQLNRQLGAYEKDNDQKKPIYIFREIADMPDAELIRFEKERKLKKLEPAQSN